MSTRRGLIALALSLALGPAALASLPTAQAATPTTVMVDAGTRFQTVQGWGTFLAWWANVVGGWSATTRDQVADLLFSDSGLGLNIARSPSRRPRARPSKCGTTHQPPRGGPPSMTSA